MKVIVIGLGAIGSAALAHLARRGVESTGIDPYSLGHDRGSSQVIRRPTHAARFLRLDRFLCVKGQLG